MKRVLSAITLCVLAASSAPAAILVIEFSPGTGSWSYDGQDKLYINQTVLIDRGMSSVSDALVDNSAVIKLPYSFEVTGAGGPGPYGLFPSGEGLITIEGSGGVYFRGYLHCGDLKPVSPTSTLAGGYTFPAFDILDYEVTPAGLALNSDALNAIEAHGQGMLDFDIVFSGAVDGFQNMLQNGLQGFDNFSGSISIPEPATIAMLSLGGLALLRRRKQLT